MVALQKTQSPSAWSILWAAGERFIASFETFERGSNESGDINSLKQPIIGRIKSEILLTSWDNEELQTEVQWLADIMKSLIRAQRSRARPWWEFCRSAGSCSWNYDCWAAFYLLFVLLDAAAAQMEPDYLYRPRTCRPFSVCRKKPSFLSWAVWHWTHNSAVVGRVGAGPTEKSGFNKEEETGADLLLEIQRISRAKRADLTDERPNLFLPAWSQAR